MNTVLSIQHFKKYLSSYLLDGLALLLVYFIPSISHLTGIPFYLFEPMRVFIILALVHSNKTNAYVLAFTLPLFSFAIASHPVFSKSIIMTFELVLNVYLYHLLVEKKMANYQAIILSVISSKLVYYLLKFGLIHFLFLQSNLVSTPIYIQFITLSIFAIYAFFMLRRGKN
ncbi:MAG: hypothetical protein JW729_04230 [Bacteroidales bacterium]|nr:hypothetical protein [Bacteroidales bacterium]